MKNIIEGKKIEFFFQIVGAILDKEGLAVNVYYPEKKKDISLKVSRNTIENYIRLLIGSSDEETLYDQLTSKSDAKVEQYYPNGKIKSRITFNKQNMIDKFNEYIKMGFIPILNYENTMFTYDEMLNIPLYEINNNWNLS